MEKVFIVMFHDESWGSHGDYIIGVFKNEDEANKQCKLFEETRPLLDGDEIYVDERDLLDEAYVDDEFFRWCV